MVAASLRADIDTKIEADLKRLATTTKTKAVIYCTTHPLTEQAVDALEADIRRRFPKLDSVRVLGRTQFEYLGERYEEIVRRHYAGEILNIEDTLLRSPLNERPQQAALRLALLTQTGDDAHALRLDLTRRLVLETLAVKGALGAGQIAVNISQTLHLARSVSREYVEHIVSDLAKERLVDRDNTVIGLSTAGKEYLTAPLESATARLLEGRASVRAAILGLSGHNLTDAQFERVWRTLQDALSETFWSHGQTIVGMISSLVTGHATRPNPDEYGLLQRLGDKVHQLFDDAEQAEEVRQAVIDMFSQKGSDAFEWLTQIAAVYVTMCSLGFEALSSEEVTRALRGYQLVTDSDITISLICQREENHEEVVHVLRGWRALGGTLLAAVPVLEEAAYHAWISERDYRALHDQLEEMSDVQAGRIIYNAFVRTFRKLRKEGSRGLDWRRYISQYRGSGERDYGPLVAILHDEERFTILEAPKESDAGFAREVQERIVQLRAKHAGCRPEDLDYRARDKALRDGWLIASVRAARRKAHESGGGAILIMSSSGLLREVGDALHGQLGEGDLVVSTAAVACLLTLVPGTHMGLGTLRGVLFDLGLAERLTPVQRYAYRIIALSGHWDVPWARRVTLKKQLGARLLSDAKARGKSVASLVDRVLHAEDPQFSAKLMVDTLSGMAVSSKDKAALEEEVQRLRARIRELESER